MRMERAVESPRGRSSLPFRVRSVLAVAAALVLTSHAARADEIVAARAPRLLAETGENTTVIDAFDKDDPFDANLFITLRQSFKGADIRRESTLAQPGLASGGYLAQNENVAKYRQSVTTLELGGDIGIWKDLALSLRVPLTLADSRELTDLNGSTRNPERLQDPAGNPLFSLPFKSPTRSGIDHIAVALNYAVTNQQRDPVLPTWVVGVETRYGIGARLHACNDDAAVKCPDPANPSLSRDAGISRGMFSVIAQTTVAKRFGYLEPYVGFMFMFETPMSNPDYSFQADQQGAILERPPMVGTFTAGTEVIPWENKEDFQRFSLDFKARASYHSPGRDYSELFDALGSSQAPSLRNPNAGGYRLANGGTTSVADETVPPVYFTGITDQAAFSTVAGRFGLTWQTSKYVKFNAGVGLQFIQNHLITATDACNPAGSDVAATSGPCRRGTQGATGGTATGTPNANHRQVIDLPGRRFSADNTTIVDLWLSGVVMF